MSTQPSRYPLGEVARRGDEIYNRVVRPQVDESQKGKVVAIDIESEAFAIGDTALAASQRLREEHADAVVWLMRIGHRALHHMGGRPRTAS
ncbi:MAG: hypothetical protein WEB58_02905 [Planctomycetaceae bacterium]